jgi:hypothetical protein
MRIVIKLQIEGVHSWSNCDIDEVRFLKNLHRHIFHIRVEKEVTHDDRDIEIIQLKRDIEELICTEFWDEEFRCNNFFDMSCESIAKFLKNAFELNLVEVLEDNENGAIIR